MRGGSKAAALVLSTAVSVAGAWVVWSWWCSRAPSDLEFHEAGDELDEIKLERAVYAAERAAEWTPVTEPSERAYYLSEDHVERLFGLGKRERDPRRYDPWAYTVQMAGRHQVVGWGEHPDRRYLLSTNEDGLRDDPIDWEADPDVRVLVAGDSHTFGVCAKEESYPGRLEARLREAWPEKTFDVLNTGQGGYTFYNYLGMLEKYLSLEPDVFVLGVYGGNDFSELVGLAHTFGEAPRGHFTKEQQNLRRDAMQSVSKAAMGQCYTGAFFFEYHPEHVAHLYEVSLDLVFQMRAVCESRGIAMIVAFIPAPCGLAWDRPIPAFEEVREFLGLGEDTLGVLDELATRFVDDVRASGLPVVDLGESIEDLDAAPYWRRDQHLNLDGHELLAARLQPLVEEWAFAQGRLSPR